MAYKQFLVIRKLYEEIEWEVGKTIHANKDHPIEKFSACTHPNCILARAVLGVVKYKMIPPKDQNNGGGDIWRT